MAAVFDLLRPRLTAVENELAAHSVLLEDLAGGASSAVTHQQAVPSSEWVIAHGLGTYPDVTVIDSSGSLVFGDVTYTNLNTVTLTFGAAFGGQAILRR
ncbi:MAG TPA: hypothetical protein VF595_05930 [Tepidisphaeraceae bacterium]